MAQRWFKGRLWSHRDFLRLWTGETVSQAGTQVTLLAFPSVAILFLHAGPFEVGMLTALEFLAFPVLGLFAGVTADRVRRRPILILSDLGRMVALASVPVAAYLQVLTIYQMYAVALVVGVFTVFFDVSYQSYLPALIDRADLVEGNSKLEVTRSSAQVAGPGIAGLLIQTVGGAAAIVVDSVSYLVSAIAVGLIRKPEPKPAPGRSDDEASGILAELREGLHAVFGNPIIRRTVGCTATSNLGTNMVFAVELIFLYRQLHFSPGLVGLIFATGSIGGILGALSAAALARWLGVGRTIIGSIFIGALGFFALPLSLVGPALPIIIPGYFLSQFATPVYNITQVSLRQAITPDRVQGRMNATVRTVVWGTIPLGAFIGGILGSSIGVLPTILIGCITAVSAVLWVLGRPVRRLREQPQPVGPEPAGPEAAQGLA
jgi:MFS family permease